MKKFWIFVLAIVLLVNGFIIGSMFGINNAYAIFGGGADDNAVGSVSAATGEPNPVSLPIIEPQPAIPPANEFQPAAPPTVTIDQAKYESLLQELDAYKALESFWATETLIKASCPTCSGGVEMIL